MRTYAAILSFALFCNVLPAAVYSFTIVASLVATCPAANATFTHPGILHSRAELDFVKAKVAEGEEPWKSAWEELRSHDISELDGNPKPIADVVRGVRNHPDIGGTNLMRDGAAAYSHAIQWYVTGKQPHADKAIEMASLPPLSRPHGSGDAVHRSGDREDPPGAMAEFPRFVGHPDARWPARQLRPVTSLGRNAKETGECRMKRKLGWLVVGLAAG